MTVALFIILIVAMVIGILTNHKHSYPVAMLLIGIVMTIAGCAITLGVGL